MNRIAIIITIGLLALAAAFVGAGFLIGPDPITPPPITQQKPLPPPVSSEGVPEPARTEEAVSAAFISTLPTDDTTEVRAVSIAGDYALLNWSDEIMGGQALLKYNQTRSFWAVVTMIGGAFGVAELREAGVPQRTTLTLLNGLNR